MSVGAALPIAGVPVPCPQSMQGCRVAQPQGVPITSGCVGTVPLGLVQLGRAGPCVNQELSKCATEEGCSGCRPQTRRPSWLIWTRDTNASHLMERPGPLRLSSSAGQNVTLLHIHVHASTPTSTSTLVRAAATTDLCEVLTVCWALSGGPKRAASSHSYNYTGLLLPPTLQMTKLRPREVKQLTQGHTAWKRQKQNGSGGVSDPDPTPHIPNSEPPSQWAF